MHRRRLLGGLFAFAPVPLLVGQNSLPPKVDFVHDVQPILRAHCSPCHVGDQKQGGLSFESLKLLEKGGDSGRLSIKGNANESLLVKRIIGVGGPQMPMGFGPLSAKDQGLIKAWIDQGCLESESGRKQHWAFIAPTRPKLPETRNSQWVKNPIDAFVLNRLNLRGLHPSPEADKVTLLRRVTLDLTGLPPTPAEVDSFVADRSPNAYEKVVDRLFASPHYGERMALPWLDAARYADSNGFQQDGDTYQYVWRDWVVKAMNANMRFDEFTKLQLAGDLLPAPRLDQIVATGFNRNHMLNGEGGAIPEEQRNVALFDRVDTTATTWLGLTMTCARCHDHKYDPLTQKDYYSMMAFFNNLPETGVPSDTIGSYYLAKPWVFAGAPDEMVKLSQLEEMVKLAKDAKDKTEKQKQLDEFANKIPRVMVMSDAQPRKTHIYSRGNYEAPLAEVSANTPGFLPAIGRQEPRNRLGLADWLMSPNNPLTSRVQVNRYWQTFFGKGLVKTPENFGVQSEPPTYPDLLDWLAVEFRESGWNVKHIQRLIVTSATYRQTSKVTPATWRSDPANQFLARGARFRLPSMLLRDVALASSGLIDLSLGGKPVYPYQPKAIWAGLNITDERDFSYPQSKGKDLYRRSIYTFWRRTIGPGDMFDASSRQVCTVRASQTSTPLHALTTLNDVTWVEAGRTLAEQVLREVNGSPETKLTEAFRRVCARRPSTRELKILRRMLDRSLKTFGADQDSAVAYLHQGESHRDSQIDPIRHAAYATVCLAIYNLDEALTRE